MSKFHINKHGVPAPCKATQGKCPLGGDSGDEGHFDSEEAAQDFADEKHASEYGYVSEVIPAVKTYDGVELKEGDTVHTFSANGEEFIYADYDSAEESANMKSDDGDYYDDYAYATGNIDHVEPEEVKVSAGMVAHLNKTNFEPKEIPTIDGKVLSEGDEVYRYSRGGKSQYYANQENAIKAFESDKENNLIHSNPHNNPNRKETVSSGMIESDRPEYKDGNKSYAVHSEVNERLSQEPITNDNVGSVMDKSLENGSYKVQHSSDASNSMDVRITKVEDGKYVAKGVTIKTGSEGGTSEKQTDYVSFNEGELKEAMGNKDNSKPADLFSGIHSIVSNKTK